MSPQYTEEWVTYGDGPDKTSFYTRKYDVANGQPKAHLVFIHGFVEHCARYDRALSQWAAKGISVFTFDQRGYGKTATDEENKSAYSSYGKTSWGEQMQDITFFITREKERIGSGVPMFLMGHSMVRYTSSSADSGFQLTPTVIRTVGRRRGFRICYILEGTNQGCARRA